MTNHYLAAEAKQIKRNESIRPVPTPAYCVTASAPHATLHSACSSVNPSSGSAFTSLESQTQSSTSGTTKESSGEHSSTGVNELSLDEDDDSVGSNEVSRRITSVHY